MQGRVVYHADAMQRCLDGYADIGCVEYATQAGSGPAGCADAFDPQVADGGECGNDIDRVSGWCVGDSLDLEGNLTYGACGPLPGAGDPCDDNDCPDGLDCDFSTDTWSPTE